MPNGGIIAADGTATVSNITTTTAEGISGQRLWFNPANEFDEVEMPMPDLDGLLRAVRRGPQINEEEMDARQALIRNYLNGGQRGDLTDKEIDDFVYEMKKKMHLPGYMRTVLHKPAKDGELFTDSVNIDDILPP